MNEVNLIVVCIIAFIEVMVLLGFMAVVMTGMTRLFPVPRPTSATDAPIVAAIQSVVASRFGGARVVRIEEKR